MNSYPDQGNRRPSTNTSVRSSKYTDNGFTCPRVRCHCEAANREEQDPTDSVSLEGSQSRRRRAEYFHRPAVLGPYSGTRIWDESPYPYFHYEKLSEAEYCEQCQFCWALSRWCGRLPGSEVEKPPMSSQQNISTAGFTGTQKKIPFPNATWVREPLMVNAARVFDDNFLQREREQFVPTVFSHTLTSQSLKDLPARNITFLREERNLSLESIRPCRTLPQTPAKDCQRFRFCKDIRGARRDTWAFEEGSLVIGIHPSFVDLNQQLIQEDEFELRYGEVYIICRMFADKWALCARLRMSDTIMPVKNSDLVDHGFENIKFLPLCAVTLAANFASFDRRWSEYRMRCPYSSTFPSGGLRVTPPLRCDSLLASIEVAACNFGSLHVPWIVFHLCKPRIPLPPKTEYVPYHPPKGGIGRLIDNTINGRNTLGRMWRTIVPCEASQSRSPSDNPEIYLEKELDLLEDDISSVYEPDPTHEEQLSSFNIRSPMKKRKSIRQLFFGSRRYK
ncbi:hypothetical protein PISL3812_05059 [Talaromyces islandicus]|uniref:Uncharacterized protein n=1 Tax=Talaromyces islandicus TaxID=28573 RepID=A0A0U1LXE3_TALIS|nr:hypothetical protein PISL3812_05059 [Talaromyces islandicus]